MLSILSDSFLTATRHHTSRTHRWESPAQWNERQKQAQQRLSQNGGRHD